jgi:hypothetical protein
VGLVEALAAPRHSPLVAPTRLEPSDEHAVTLEARVLPVEPLQAADEQDRAEESSGTQRATWPTTSALPGRARPRPSGCPFIALAAPQAPERRPISQTDDEHSSGVSGSPRITGVRDSPGGLWPQSLMHEYVAPLSIVSQN